MDFADLDRANEYQAKLERGSIEINTGISWTSTFGIHVKSLDVVLSHLLLTSSQVLLAEENEPINEFVKLDTQTAADIHI